MFLLLGLGLTQYFSGALTWFWENSLLIKYSGKWLSRDLLMYVYEPRVPLPTELPFLERKYNLGTTFSSSALLITKAPAPHLRGDNVENLKGRQLCLGPGFLPCLLCEPP